MESQQIQFDLSLLPERARIELMDFYEFLTQKYRQEPEKAKADLMGNDISPSKNTKPLVRGRLKAYSNPRKIPMEKELGWERAMKEKHATS